MQMRSVPIIGSTCLTVSRSHLLRSRLFDVCVFDEASQATLPASLPPLLRSRTFVLVGDLYQLPPLVRSCAAEVRPQSPPSLCCVATQCLLAALLSTCAPHYHSDTVRRWTVAMDRGMGSGRAGGAGSETADQASSLNGHGCHGD
jgi:hypothetical protein